jgi:hypothetical protein
MQIDTLHRKDQEIPAHLTTSSIWSGASIFHTISLPNMTITSTARPSDKRNAVVCRRWDLVAVVSEIEQLHGQVIELSKDL